MNRSMKVDARTLAEEAAWMAKLRPGNGISPAIKTVQVSALLGALQLRRTDFDQWRESVVPAEGAGQFSALVDAGLLADILKPMTGQVTVEFGERLTVATGGTSASLRTVDADYPAWPTFIPVDTAITASPAQAARALTSVGTDETLPMLMAVAFDKGTMVTTDRFRLSRISYDGAKFTTTVPGEVLKAFATGNDILSVQPGVGSKREQMVRLASGGRSIVVAVPEAQFPKWRQLVPDSCPIKAVVRRDDLTAAAAQGSRVTLTLRDDSTMEVLADAGENSDVEVTRTIRADVVAADEPLPFTVTMLSKYVLDAMRGLGSGTVLIGASAPKKPVVFEDPSGNVLHLVMPVGKGA